MNTQNINLTDVSAPASSGCACCSTTDHGQPATGAATEAAGLVTTYAVTGMTCGHCVGAVTSELRDLDGVQGVEIDLVAGGTSSVRVTSAGQLDDDAVSAAVAEAGYSLKGRLS